MNLTRLKVLVAVLDSGSITAAAEQLGYTPSGVSRRRCSAVGFFPPVPAEQSRQSFRRTYERSESF